MASINKINALCATLVLAVVFFFWQSEVYCTMVVAGISIIMLLLERSKGACIVYAVGLIFGPLSEAVLISAGAWTYTQPSIIGFPFWLPFVWASAALMFYRATIWTHGLKVTRR